jgi:hypothetical protein
MDAGRGGNARNEREEHTHRSYSFPVCSVCSAHCCTVNLPIINIVRGNLATKRREREREESEPGSCWQISSLDTKAKHNLELYLGSKYKCSNVPSSNRTTAKEDMFRRATYPPPRSLPFSVGATASILSPRAVGRQGGCIGSARKRREKCRTARLIFPL